MTVSSLQFDCSRGVAVMELSEVTIRSLKIYPATDKAARYVCAAILKDSSFNETDPAECQLFTTATILENGARFAPFRPPKISINGFFESIEDIWNRIWEGLVASITGKVGSACAATAFASERTFPPLYDWWEDHLWDDEQGIRDTLRHKKDVNGDRELGPRQQHNARKRRSIYQEHRPGHSGRDADYYHYLHHVQKDKSKHRGSKKSNVPQQVYLDGPENSNIGGHHRHRKERDRGRTV
uniref:Generative cell specific-1/HAP2 domain-containing protein n=1 Tax=Populus trichocarpa TaxID=3694 RepID=B9GW75_POPTR